MRWWVASWIGTRSVRAGLTISVITLLGLSALGWTAAGAPLRRLVPGSVKWFAIVGPEYAAWQVSKAKPIVLLDTRTGHREDLTPPAGCSFYMSPGADRFIVECEEGEHGESEELFDVKTGKLTSLPLRAPDGEKFGWFSVGSRYLLGGEEKGYYVYDIATGEISGLRRRAHFDPNVPGGSMHAVCRALRGRAVHFQRFEFNENFAYTPTLFASASEGRFRGGVRLRHCDGKASVLGPRKREVTARDIEINGGVLTWDTGEEREEATPRVYQGTLYAYDLASQSREFWRLPIERAIYPEFPNERGTYGYSAHTANMVFWLANADMTEGRILEVDRWKIYAAKR